MDYGFCFACEEDRARNVCLSSTVRHRQGGRGEADLPPLLHGAGLGALRTCVHHRVRDHSHRGGAHAEAEAW